MRQSVLIPDAHDINAIETKDFAHKESKISKTLSERTTRTVIVLILIMLFCMPIFQLETFIIPPTSYEKGLYMIMSMNNKTGYTEAHNSFIDEHRIIDNYLLQIETPTFGVQTYKPLS